MSAFCKHFTAVTLLGTAVLAAGIAAPASANLRVETRTVLSDTASVPLAELFGRSGKVRLVPLSARRLMEQSGLASLARMVVGGGSEPKADGRVRLTPLRTTPEAAASVQSASLVPLIPFSAKQGGVLRGYRIGFWPSERRGRRAPVSSTPLPEGFIEVHAVDTAVAVSESFHLGDFLTKDQRNVWPKYLVLQPRLLDKLELISAELAARGLPSKLRVMSGFRTPQYNAQGVGRRGGRAKDSRHMYGDASDVYVDENGDGMMDDLTGDGRITQADADALVRIGEAVEAAHPEMIGGLGSYKATSAHGPFVHVDVRGHRARW